jgi:AraC-like DNA-binding protein
VFGQDGIALEATILHTEDDAEQVALAEAFLRSRNLRFDPAIVFASRVVDKIAVDRTLLRVEDVARAKGVSRRKLERVFRQYVGVSPKWVVQRYRLFEAADRLASNPDVGAAHLAQQLGYCDQAHFINDFKAMVGRSPADYARQATGPDPVRPARAARDRWHACPRTPRSEAGASRGTNSYSWGNSSSTSTVAKW